LTAAVVLGCLCAFLGAAPAAAADPCEGVEPYGVWQQCIELSKKCQKKGGGLVSFDANARTGPCKCWDEKVVDPEKNWCSLGGLKVNYLIPELASRRIMAANVFERLWHANQKLASVLILRADTAWGNFLTKKLYIYLGIRYKEEKEPSTYLCSAEHNDDGIFFGDCAGSEFSHDGEKLFNTGEAPLDLKGVTVPKKEE
jgi:hypothetical protein